MNLSTLLIFLCLLVNIAFAEDEPISEEQLKKSLQSYAFPSPEQILTVGFKLEETALSMVEPKYNKDCANKNTENLEIKENDPKDKCFICAVMNAENDRKYQLLVGRVTKEKKEEDQSIASSLLSPREMSISYSGSNDQPFHGLIEPMYSIGDDFNGHTYGSNFNLGADYKWGSLSLDLGTDLYVSSYNYYVNGYKYMNATSDTTHKILQEADEHTYLRLGAKYYLDDSHDKNAGEKLSNQYLKFGLGIEHDSDQGLGGPLGAISHREGWHSMFGYRNNQYINHFKDQTTLTGNVKAGLETYRPIGKLGFCTAIEAGLSANTTGTIKTETAIKAAIDTGTMGGGTRNNPLFVINFEAGVSTPISSGSGPIIETDSTYNNPDGKNGSGINPNGGAYAPYYLTNKNYSLIDNIKNSYAKVGIEYGDKYKFSLDVIYEKNQWTNGEIIYMATIKKKF